MAGSRTEKVGTIFSRVTGIIRARALKDKSKPIWYEVWKAFPPKYEPTHDRPPVNKDIHDIFYKEDLIRARFYKAYPNATINVTKDKITSISQKFIHRYRELEISGKCETEEDIFLAAASTMTLPGSKPQPEITIEKVEEKIIQITEEKIDIKVADIMEMKTAEVDKERHIPIDFDISDILGKKIES